MPYDNRTSFGNHPVIYPIFLVGIEINALLGYINIKMQTVQICYSFLKVYNYFDIIHICSLPTTICVKPANDTPVDVVLSIVATDLCHNW